MNPINTADILHDIRSAREEASKHVDAFALASAELVVAKAKYETAEADAFIAAKANKASDELAKRIAHLKVADLKQEMDRALEAKRAASLGGSLWSSVVESYAALSHALNRELRLGE